MTRKRYIIRKLNTVKKTKLINFLEHAISQIEELDDKTVLLNVYTRNNAFIEFLDKNKYNYEIIFSESVYLMEENK